MAKKRSKAQLEADKLRTGRPPKQPEEKQGEQVTVYLTKSERAELERQAQNEGISLTALIMRPWREKEK